MGDPGTSEGESSVKISDLSHPSMSHPITNVSHTYEQVTGFLYDKGFVLLIYLKNSY